MKKFVVLLVVVALTCITSMAFAASEISVSGEMAIRSRAFTNLDMNKASDDTSPKDTQERVRLDVNAKAGDVKGKISIWNDFDTWGRFEDMQANGQQIDTTYSGGSAIGMFGFLKLREAWISFNLPGLPVNVTGGHQLLSLGNGWFFRSMHYGSDAWVIANQTGNNTVAFVDVKFAENNPAAADDTDAYVILDVLKLSDAATVGIDVTDLQDRTDKATGTTVDLQNIGLNFNGKLGPVALKAELDMQMGKVKNAVGGDNKFKGNQIVAQGNVPMDPVTINFTVARGTGDEFTTTPTAGADIKSYQNALDIDPHYTFLYEYKIASRACLSGGGAAQAHKGFCNTTALSAGASFAASKNLTVGADFWMLNSTAKVQDMKAAAAGDPNATTNKLGTEVDVKVNWKLADNLSWNWTLGYFKGAEGMSAVGDAATGAQGILSFTF